MSKSALLHHQWIIPLDHHLETIIYNYPDMADIDTITEKNIRTIFRPNFLPPLLRDQQFYDALLETSRDLLLYHIACANFLDKDKRDGVLSAFGETISSIEARALPRLGVFADKFGLRGIPLEFEESDTTGAQQGPQHIISTLLPNIIDTNAVSWDKVLAFREDASSMKKLSRFRSFVYENYEGKPPAFVEDDVLARLDDYEFAIRSWEFETKQGTLNMVLNSKALAAGATGSFLSSMVGLPLAALASAGGVCVLELGRICCAFAWPALLSGANA